MQRHTLAFTLLLIGALSCNQHCSQRSLGLSSETDTAVTFSSFVPKDSANKMISSYINSINYTATDTNLISVTLDAAKLKAYLLSDTTITGVKITLGHTLSYINSGGLNKACGYKNTALTMIVSCFNASGSYKYYSGSSVMDYASLCPINCPPGDAAAPLFN